MQRELDPFDPFGESADPRRYVPLPTSERILREVAARVRDGRTPVLVAGPSGVGKTLLLHVLGERERLNGQRVVYSPFLHLAPDECARWLLHLLGEHEAGGPSAQAALVAALRAPRARPTLLMVDEIQAAPELSVARLAEIAQAARPMLAVVAAGSDGRHLRKRVSLLAPEATLQFPPAFPEAEIDALCGATLAHPGLAPKLRRALAPERPQIVRAASGVPRLLKVELEVRAQNLSLLRGARRPPVEVLSLDAWEPPDRRAARSPDAAAGAPLALVEEALLSSAHPPPSSPAPARLHVRVRALAEPAVSRLHVARSRAGAALARASGACARGGRRLAQAPRAADGIGAALRARGDEIRGALRTRGDLIRGALLTRSDGVRAALRERSDGMRGALRGRSDGIRAALRAHGDGMRSALRARSAGIHAAARGVGQAVTSAIAGLAPTLAASGRVALPAALVVAVGVLLASDPERGIRADTPGVEAGNAKLGPPQAIPAAAAKLRPPRALPGAVSLSGETTAPPLRVQAQINARPWARIHIDGADVGPTPLTRALPPGTYQIRADFSDGRSLERTVEIGPEQRFVALH